MLEDLTIKDFALIDSDYIEFKKGFTVLSGETGAGKSILIGALSFLLGGKADVQQIRSGRPEASVSATFLLSDTSIRKDFNPEEEAQSPAEWLSAHGIEIENNRVILRRFIRDTGKSGAWINSVPVTRADLAQFSAFLVDIHGQHEHQSLMKVTEHRKFLDARAGIQGEVADFTKKYAELVEKRKKLAEMSLSDQERLRKLDMMKFAVEEITAAKLKAEEDLLLEDEQNKLSSFEKIFSEVETVNNILSDQESSLVPVLKKLLRDSSHLSEMDRSLSPLQERLESAFYELSDIAEEYSSYQSKLVFDPGRLQEVEDRLSVIYNLKKKYASSINAPLSEVITYLENAQSFIEENEDSDSYKEKLAAQIKELEREVLLLADKLSKKRIAAAELLNKEVCNILAKLGMASTRFLVSVKQKEGSALEQLCGPYGKDDIEFLISANPGNPPLPLSKIASGGELSRVMLALKTIFAQNDSVDTLIFDEVDTGIGGEVAVAVGAHMKNLAKNRQVFAITHLASIAVYADNQIKIEKSVSGQVTSSNVFIVEGQDRVAEIARMLSGDSDTEQSLEHARSLLEKYSGGI
ncbi:MAG: DNA repair protein RecN [Treponema sp.]|nr:DNA repair protein RecN [Treponema sp.]